MPIEVSGFPSQKSTVQRIASTTRSSRAVACTIPADAHDRPSQTCNTSHGHSQFGANASTSDKTSRTIAGTDDDSEGLNTGGAAEEDLISLALMLASQSFEGQLIGFQGTG
jgi:hypothetical protein